MTITKAALYARYSSAHQREESIVHQVEKIKEFASQNKIEPFAEYTNEAQSGASDRRI